MPRGRIGQTPEWAKEESERRILNSLMKRGKKTYTQLLKETNLSEPTLAKRIGDLQNRDKIIVEFSEKDRRKKFYSITLDGWDDLVRTSIKNDIDNTPLIMNQSSLHIKTEWPKWYIKHKGWDDPKKAPFSINKESHISPIFELKNRNSKIFINFWNFIYKQIFDIISDLYKNEEKQKIKVGVTDLTDQFFRYLQANFNINLFSSLKIETPQTSKFDLGLKAQILSFIPTIKMDFLTEQYVLFFEYFLKLIHGLMVENNYSFLDLFAKDNKKSKILLVLEMDFENLFETMEFYEDLRFRPKNFEKRVKEQYPRLFAKEEK